MWERGPEPRRRCGSRRRMAGLPWKWPRTRLPVGASALGVFVLCWLYVFPVYRLPDEKEIVQGVLLQQGKAWRRNQTAVALFRKLLEECCDPGQLFAMTKMNSPMGKNLWFDGEFLYSVTIDNATYSLFPQATPFQLPLKKCSVVGNGGILKKSGCGKQIDQADFVMRCNLPPLSSEYSKDVGSKTQLVTANPSIIQKRERKRSPSLWGRGSLPMETVLPELLQHGSQNCCKVPESAVVPKSLCGQCEDLQPQLHLHASLLHENGDRALPACLLHPGGFRCQAGRAVCQPQLPAGHRQVLEEQRHSRQAPFHGTLPGQRCAGAVRGGDNLRLLALLGGPAREVYQPSLL
ncbi:alpha-N-acetylneuraminide alpha-2,8-sialyltransferase isoform X2 [Passer domesticus]|uniref:alpha-N-acetylneuraminide alpha-2,8-sialyltransferase isoform X2 n=1 Tax=Passer domesticus TaxID=48849 RepID=UPI0030FE1841